MASDFPIPIPEKLPSRIEKCPIVGAGLEIRFVTNEQWRNLPGLLYAQIRDHYPQQQDLPLAQLPEEFRHRDANLTYQPVVQFFSNDFIVQFGPRSICLSTKQNAYPGWTHFFEEMKWLLERLEKAAFVVEGERLGVRYVDFFEHNLFPNLAIQTSVAGTPLQASEMSLAVGLRKEQFTARLQVANAAFVLLAGNPKSGSVLDVDVWLGATDFDLFSNGLTRFEEAHTLVKQIFFGLLKPEFLATLNPTY